MKFHEDRCKGEAFMRLKPFYLTTRLQTDGRTDRVIPVNPPNFVAGGYKKVFPPTRQRQENGVSHSIITIYLLKQSKQHTLSPFYRPFRRPITGLVLNVSFWPELEHKMVFVYARKDDVAVASF